MNRIIGGTTRPAPHGTIVNGVPWFDDRGETVNAHGGCIVEDGGRYYLFGEYKTDDENVFAGFSCYSSPDLVTWRFERIALPRQAGGLLGPARIGERAKVMRCPATGRFMMYMHTDDLTYTDPCIGVAVSDTIAGEYEFRGALRHDGAAVRGWDMGTFQDDDGRGYLLLHEGDVLRLSDDYTTVSDAVVRGVAPGGESPAMLRGGDRYFLLFSNKTSWERNDNYYLSAAAIEGPWEHGGPVAPPGTLTHNSQCTFVLTRSADGRPLPPMYLGDRWSFPHQASAATYVWLPLTIEGDRLSMTEYRPAWDPATAEPVDLRRLGTWQDLEFTSTIASSAVEAPFDGRRVAVHGTSTPSGGYARVDVLAGEHAEPLHSAVVDFYSKVPDDGWRYLSPELPAGPKRIRVTNLGESPVWYDKARHRFGSDGTRVTTAGLLTLN
ncbi:family 43 glycosylhydrolase [Myceligenerans halotolerans]